MDRGAWGCAVHGAVKSRARLSNQAHTHTHTHTHPHTLTLMFQDVKPCPDPQSLPPMAESSPALGLM